MAVLQVRFWLLMQMDFKRLAEEIVKGSNSSLESGTVAEILKSVFDKLSKGARGSKDLELGRIVPLIASPL